MKVVFCQIHLCIKKYMTLSYLISMQRNAKIVVKKTNNLTIVL